MKTPKTAFAVGYIDDDLIRSAEKCGTVKKNSSKILKWTSLAACLVLIIGACTVMLPLDRGGDVSEPELNESTGKDNVSDTETSSSEKIDISGNTNISTDRYKEHQFGKTEVLRAWPWEMLAVFEKYQTIVFNGNKFYGARREISEKYIETQIGMGVSSGIAWPSGVSYNEEFELYKIKDVSSDHIFAAKLDDKYYVFQSTPFSAPHKNITLGEFFEIYGLEKTIELNLFYNNQKAYTLKSDDYIFETLGECLTTPIINTDQLKPSNQSKKSIGFSVSSEQLGIYKLSLTITIEGYLKTNLTGYGYSFFIGEDAAKKIIDYAESNATPTESEPYNYMTIGKIVELTDEYVIIDDSFLCKDEREGVLYKILLNDIRVSRWFTDKMNYVGRVVLIVHENKPVVENGVVIDSAIDVEFPYITIDGQIYIPE